MSGNAAPGLSPCPNRNLKKSQRKKRLRRLRLRARLTTLRQAAVHHWRRTLAAGAVFLALLVVLAITWTYTARFAIQHERERLNAALTALDAGDYEQARSLVRHVLNNVGLPRQEYGTPLFVLGAVKTFDAGNDIVPDRRRTGYLVASRYLTEAHSYGWPPSREKQGLLLLGKSLVESFPSSRGHRRAERSTRRGTANRRPVQRHHSSIAGRGALSTFSASIRASLDARLPPRSPTRI